MTWSTQSIMLSSTMTWYITDCVRVPQYLRYKRTSLESFGNNVQQFRPRIPSCRLSLSHSSIYCACEHVHGDWPVDGGGQSKEYRGYNALAASLTSALTTTSQPALKDPIKICPKLSSSLCDICSSTDEGA